MFGKLQLFIRYGTVAPRSSIGIFFRPGATDQQLTLVGKSARLDIRTEAFTAYRNSSSKFMSGNSGPTLVAC